VINESVENRIPFLDAVWVHWSGVIVAMQKF
jgi:hypothetical protein